MTNRNNQRYTIRNVKHPASIMVWGCFSGKGGRGSLYFLPPKVTMNSDSVHCHAEGKIYVLEKTPEGKALPSFLLPHQQKMYGLPQVKQGLCDGLAGQLT
jgi:hypothetical protein